MVSVRYIVDDVDSAVAFYRDRLGFEVKAQPGPGFAMLARGDLRLLLNTPDGQLTFLSASRRDSGLSSWASQ